MKSYPIKFQTIFKDKLWGGEKIKTVLGKDFSPLPNCGETWELSGVKENVSVVSNGIYKDFPLTELILRFGDELLGSRVHKSFGNEFPLLVKFIDANQDLSIQVHPNDDLARKRHDSFGKTEMWYILQADEDSSLISGFNRELDKETYLSYFRNGQLMEILNREPVKAGDVFFLPAGRVHTIGRGLLLAEIQQTSDVTYRIYDFDRVDDQGNKRELHVEESLDAIDFKKYDTYKTSYQDQLDQSIGLVDCPYFTTNKLHLTNDFRRDHTGLDSFKIYICVEGSTSVSYQEEQVPLSKGEVILIPAALEQYTFETSNEVVLLEAYIPK